MSLAEHRDAIDKLDKQIIKLLNERTKHACAIGEYKLQHGQEIYAPHREQSVLKRICDTNEGPIRDSAMRAIYREIMSSSLSLEKTMTIAYLGPAATFTHQAAIQRFGSSLSYVPQKTIADVFAEVEKHRADYGVVPIENSTEGVVNHTLDMFIDSEMQIVAQILLPISHCLLSKIPRKKIKKLYVHPQTRAQCRSWIQMFLPDVEIVETSSNARSTEMAKRSRTAAAIAGQLCSEKYNLPIVEHNIQDNAANATRFLVLGRQCSPPTGKDRTSIMFSIADKSGALHDSLAPFRRLKINLTKIESRPTKRRAWRYFFFVDLDGHAKEKKIEKALGQLEQHCSFVKVLGSYPNSE
ncbi:MAG: prephenate dehydratase [Verrucomicrobiales bacterium]|mgnify:CR=1 FL=1|nr:prephenate dehydratase [Verrucomicrobiales bacterium]|tara:strand:- start:1520 stop:2581 length:1062 start_codon:yes stop_codon:yes gene_type:complete